MYVPFWWLLWYLWRSMVSKMYYVWEGRRFIHMTLHTSWLSEPPDSECIIYCSWHGCKELEIFSERHSNWRNMLTLLMDIEYFVTKPVHTDLPVWNIKSFNKVAKTKNLWLSYKNLNIKAEKWRIILSAVECYSISKREVYVQGWPKLIIAYLPNLIYY